jgi:MYXO-CTERM domain-containing protein
MFRLFQKERPMRGLACFAAIAVIASTTHASTVTYTSDPGLEGLGAFSGSTQWTYLGGNAGVVTVTLLNTSAVANGGYLTGFAFNVRANDSLKVEYDEALAGWDGIVDASAVPYGNFDHGAALGGNWLGGGSPLAGIGVGEMFSFRFDVRGDASLLATMVAHDFFDESKGFGFVARFRGFGNGGSDKVTATLPAPGAMALFALGALAGTRRRR